MPPPKDCKSTPVLQSDFAVIPEGPNNEKVECSLRLTIHGKKYDNTPGDRPL
jgi:hypothetical protein